MKDGDLNQESGSRGSEQRTESVYILEQEQHDLVTDWKCGLRD